MSGQVFLANHGETQSTIKLTRLEEGRYEVEINGERRTVDARRFAGGTWSLLIDDQSYDVELEVSSKSESEGGYNALVRGHVVSGLVVQDERQAKMGGRSKRFKVEGPQTVECPMPGKVVKVLVEKDAEVEEGQPLIIVEAMKMENELKSPKAGKITNIVVSEGQAVEAGAKLLTVE